MSPPDKFLLIIFILGIVGFFVFTLPAILNGTF